VADHRERGATVVEFLGVTLLIASALMVLLQMALWLWARNVAVNAADEGARFAAEQGRPLTDGETRTRAVLHDGLGASANAFDVRAVQAGSAVTVVARGVAPRVVPFLPTFTIRAEARAVDEDVVTR
jgi:Flp pilus assembly protein TadG